MQIKAAENIFLFSPFKFMKGVPQNKLLSIFSNFRSFGEIEYEL